MEVWRQGRSPTPPLAGHAGMLLQASGGSAVHNSILMGVWEAMSLSSGGRALTAAVC